MSHRLAIVYDSDAADFGSVRVTLFSSDRYVCGWYLSPIAAVPVADGYVPKSAKLIASCAVLRAIAVAERLGVAVCIIDPDDLWKRGVGRSRIGPVRVPFASRTVSAIVRGETIQSLHSEEAEDRSILEAVHRCRLLKPSWFETPLRGSSP